MLHTFRRASVRRSVTFRPQIEMLEDRRTPSATTNAIPLISYQGGALLQHVRVVTVYYGDAWQTDPVLEQQSQQLDTFFAHITDSSYMDMLSEYAVGRGSLAAHVNTPLSQPINSDGSLGALTVTDGDIQNM